MAGLTDAEMAQRAGDGPEPLRPLTDEEMATRAAAAPTGMGEAAARLFYKHLTFGTEPGADRKRSEQAATEHPYVNLGAAVPAFVAQTAALGPLAAAGKAVQGAGIVARAARGAGTAADFALLPNTEARTALEAARTGAKLGGNYSALETLGSDATNPDKGLADTAKDVATSYGAGTALGGVFGAGAHGASRVVGAVANRTMPGLSDAMAAARSPEAQGIRDITRHARYDDADLSRLEQQLVRAQTDPQLKARYDDLNLLESLKAGELKPTAAGELKPEVITARNLDDLAKHAANTEGRGQNIAAEAFASRKNETSAKMQEDIDAHFNSGNRAADAAAQDAQKAELSGRYNRFRNKERGITFTERDFGPLAQRPGMREAFDYAAEAEMSRPGNIGEHAWTGREGQDFLTPGNILDMHHYLVLKANSSFNGDKAQAARAIGMKNAFQNWIDNNFSKKFASLNEDFATFRRVMDAKEQGANMAASGEKAREAFRWYGTQKANQESQLNGMQQRIADAQAVFDATQKRWEVNPSNPGMKAAVTKARNRVEALQDSLENRAQVTDEFRKAYGTALKQYLAEHGDLAPSQLVKSLTTQEGKRRILELLGPEKGQSFIESLYNKGLQQRLGNTLYGGSDTAFKLQKRETLDALSNAASGILHLRPKAVWDAMGELASSAFRQKRADRVNEIMSQQGIDNVLGLVRSANAQQQLTQTGNPVRNLLFNGIGPVGAVAADDMNALAGPQRKRQTP